MSEFKNLTLDVADGIAVLAIFKLSQYSPNSLGLNLAIPAASKSSLFIAVPKSSLKPKSA